MICRTEQASRGLCRYVHGQIAGAGPGIGP
jgi:hypothetical protein